MVLIIMTPGPKFNVVLRFIQYIEYVYIPNLDVMMK